MYIKTSRSYLSLVAESMNIKKPLKSRQKLSNASCVCFLKRKRTCFKENSFKPHGTNCQTKRQSQKKSKNQLVSKALRHIALSLTVYGHAQNGK